MNKNLYAVAVSVDNDNIIQEIVEASDKYECAKVQPADETPPVEIAVLHCKPVAPTHYPAHTH